MLKTPYGLDDLRWTTSNGGTLYVVDLGAGTPGKSAIYKVTGPFTKNAVLASNDSLSDQVVEVNLNTGALTPFIHGLNTTKGLVYLDPSGTSAALIPNGSPDPDPRSSNTGLIIGIVLGALALLALGGFVRWRARTA